MIGAAEVAEMILARSIQPRPKSHRALKQRDIAKTIPITWGVKPTISVKKKAKIKTLERPIKLLEPCAAP
jgi:hypothetical protein